MGRPVRSAMPGNARQGGGDVSQGMVVISAAMSNSAQESGSSEGDANGKKSNRAMAAATAAQQKAPDLKPMMSSSAPALTGGRTGDPSRPTGASFGAGRTGSLGGGTVPGAGRTGGLR